MTRTRAPRITLIVIAVSQLVLGLAFLLLPGVAEPAAPERRSASSPASAGR